MEFYESMKKVEQLESLMLLADVSKQEFYQFLNEKQKSLIAKWSANHPPLTKAVLPGLEERTFSLIPLEKELKDFMGKYQKQVCSLCKDFPENGNIYICLLCNDCFCSRSCSEKAAPKRKSGNLTYHAKKCHSRACAFLSYPDTELLYIFSKFSFKNDTQSLYTDTVGEPFRGKKIENWHLYSLNEDVRLSIQKNLLFSTLFSEICLLERKEGYMFKEKIF